MLGANAAVKRSNEAMFFFVIIFPTPLVSEPPRSAVIAPACPDTARRIHDQQLQWENRRRAIDNASKPFTGEELTGGA
jgi:hypothetical protein